MAINSRLSDYIAGGVAQDTIWEGSLVTPTASGNIRDYSDLPNVQLAASGTVYPVFVAFAPPDNFPRPVNKLQYTANYKTTIRRDVNTGWGDPIDTYTYYRQGLSSLEAPVLESGMLVQLHRGGSYTLPSGQWINETGITTPGALVKVSDDADGQFQLTTDTSLAVGFVESYDGQKQYLTVTLKQ